MTDKKVEKKIEYDRLLHLTKKMHLWIFLHTGDEESVYKELGITDEEDVILGYSGKMIMKVDKE